MFVTVSLRHKVSSHPRWLSVRASSASPFPPTRPRLSIIPLPLAPLTARAFNSARLRPRVSTWPRDTEPKCDNQRYFKQYGFYTSGAWQRFYDNYQAVGNTMFDNGRTVFAYWSNAVAYFCSYQSNLCNVQEWVDAVGWAQNVFLWLYLTTRDELAMRDLSGAVDDVCLAELPASEFNCYSSRHNPESLTFAADDFKARCDNGESILGHGVKWSRTGSSIAYGCSYGGENPCSSAEYDAFQLMTDDLCGWWYTGFAHMAEWARTARTGPTYFYLDLSPLCQDYIDSIQTRPRSALRTETRREMLQVLRNCTTKNLYEKFPCLKGIEPSLGPKVVVEPDPEDNFYPPFEPIFESSTRPLLEDSVCTNEHASPPESKSWQSSSSGLDERDTARFALSQTPIQYMRCTSQVPPSSVAACVSSQTSKIDWLPAYIYAWSGQSTPCSGATPVFVSITFDMLSVVAHVILTILIARWRGLPPQTFSFVNLWVNFLIGFAKPIGEGILLNLSAPAPFTFMLPLLRPNGFAIAAAVSGAFGSRGWGVQYLAIDSFGTLVTFLTFHLRAPDFWNGRVVVPGEVGAPPALQAMYNGMFVATLPGALFASAYVLSGLWPVLLVVAVVTKTWAFAKLAFKIWLTWVCFFLVVLTSPFLAVWEMVWKLLHRNEAKTGERFPAVRWYAAWFTEKGNTLRLVGVVGYWTWVVLQFAVFVGRWMVLANLLPLAGDAWCPASLREVEAGSALSTVLMLGGLLGLKAFNLTV
ncbi:hypothetical protein OQA88_11561 [Cercophora sp. LCS_1]